MAARRDGAARREARLARWREIVHMWHAGMTLQQIARALDSTPGSIKVTVSRMRREGFAELPYRFAPPREDEQPNPSGLCLCGCGQATPIALETDRRWGRVKGAAMRHVPGHGYFRPRTGEYAVDAAGCWIWQHTLTAQGYGALTRDGERTAHRWYYRQHVGPIPAGCEVHHNCEVKACVNPGHLEALTPQEHRRRHPKEVADVVAA